MGCVAALDEVRELAERRHRDPARVLRRADQLFAHAEPAVRAGAELAAGLALQELGRIKEAVTWYGHCVETSGRHGLIEREAEGRAQLAIGLLNLGDAEAARTEIEAARALARGPAEGAVESLYGLFLYRTGRLQDALTAYDRALRLLERASDQAAIARLRLNRGIVRAYHGRLAGSLEDLAEVERIAVERDLPVLAAMAAHNVGFAHGRMGNLPEALAALDRADQAYAGLETPHRLAAVLQADRCQLLILAGLVAEATEAAEQAVAGLERSGDRVNLNECRLLHARTLLAAGEYEQAAARASAAGRHFRSSGRLPWAAIARYVALQAEVLAYQEGTAPPPGLLGRARRIARELEEQGWPVEALHVWTFVGRMALAMGRPAVARAELAQAAAARTRGTADQRAQAWHATALLGLADGDEARAKRALVRGMAVVDEYRATLGATELRANAANYGAELARLGIRLALGDGRPVEVLRWAERWRAGALRRPVVRPPGDEQLAADLVELRRLQTELEEGALQGADVGALRAKVTRLEEAVRHRTLRARDERARDTGQVSVEILRHTLGDRVLVEYVELEGALHAVTVTSRGLRLVSLGPAAPVADEKQHLLFALRRMRLPRSRTSAEEAVRQTAARLEAALVEPLGLPEGAAVVIVPTGVLHGLPWATLCRFAGRSVTVTPSAAIWLRGHGAGRAEDRADDRPTRVTLVAGPRLPGAEDEVRQVASLYPDARVLTGERATSANVLEALEDADLVHLAAHGRFRSDSPLFSCVMVADGPITVYDLERLRTAPGTVVLPACDAAAVNVRTGDELLGTATALLGLGVRSVVAPVIAVPDEATAAFMVALHTRLRRGERPAAALAAAAEGQDPAAAAAFICIGSAD